jgi:chromate transporter
LSAGVERPPDTDQQMKSSSVEILLVFLRLGFSCFGGPIAHLGYFRAEFVERRQWLSDKAYADLVALSQFLPGPASSQTGFGIGLLRGGWLGGLAAWTGFTLPSAALMLAFASGARHLSASRYGEGILHGLQLAAVAIVAQAVWGMARSFCIDRTRAAIATVSLLALLLAPFSWSQLGAITAGGLAGWCFCKTSVDRPSGGGVAPITRSAGVACLLLFAALLAIAFLPLRSGSLALFSAFYRSGALVFGGGHVVLPLLRSSVVAPGWVSNGNFLAGYGAAQAIPGPLFTVAAYLGALSTSGPGGVAGGLIALLGIFLPGMLCIAGTLPFWHGLRGRQAVQAVMRGSNAAVVGMLGAALYNPVWTSAIQKPADCAVAAAGFLCLTVWRIPPLAVVLGAAIAGLGFIRLV